MSSMSLLVMSSVSGFKRLSMKSPAISLLFLISTMTCLESNHSWGILAIFSLLFVSANSCHCVLLTETVVMLLSFHTYKTERAIMEKRRTMQVFMLRTIVALERGKGAYDRHHPALYR